MRSSTRELGPSAARRLMLAAALALTAATARAQEVADGLFVTVPNPITSDAANRVKEETTRFVQRFQAAEQARPAEQRRVPKVVLDFNPNGNPAGTRDFGPCLDLAQYLLRLHGAITIAFVRNEVTRHTVLPVLACKEVVLSERAALGNVLPEPGERPSRAERVAYEEVIEARGLCPAVVLKMLDKDMEVKKARKLKDGSTWYIDARDEKAEREKGVVVADPTPVLRAGPLSTLFSAAQAREFGLCQDFFLENRQQVAEKYQLPPTSLRGDPLQGRNPVAWRKEVRGPVNGALDESLWRSIKRAIGQGANVLILQLDCSGGDLQVAHDLARRLRNIDKEFDRPVLTVAYIPHQAPDTAAILALGCSEIVMHRDAVFGDFSAVVSERQNGQPVELDPKRLATRMGPVLELAELQGYSPLLLRGMMDRQVTIYQVKSRTGPEWRLITQEELEQDIQEAEKAGKPRRWGNERLIKKGGADGVLLTLRGSDDEKDDAKKLGIARHVVGDVRELYAVYGVPPEQVRVAGPDWLDELAAFLRSSGVSIFLVMLGITCLILELKMPGVGLPGVVAAVCFVLFFWAHSQLAGQITMLAVLLFVLGLILLGLEIFVIPGFGVVGISGAVLLVVSLALAAFEKKPETTEEWLGFGSNVATFALTAVGAVVAALVLAWYLPNIPYVNRLVLKPNEEEGELAAEAAPAIQPELAALLGAIGVAATPLRPAGKAQFGEEFVDVVAEGSYVLPGTRVQVIEIEGNRVVVKEI